jgi:hypothetical protein
MRTPDSLLSSTKIRRESGLLPDDSQQPSSPILILHDHLKVFQQVGLIIWQESEHMARIGRIMAQINMLVQVVISYIRMHGRWTLR